MSDAKRLHGRIFFGGWSICDPLHGSDEDGNPASRLHHALFPIDRPVCSPPPETVTIRRSDAIWLEAAAGAYLHLTTHPAGSESVIQQLRAVRRVVEHEKRARRAGSSQ